MARQSLPGVGTARLPDDGYDRRRVLRAVGAGFAGATALAGLSGRARSAQASEASVTFEDQTSDGQTVVVREASAEVDANLAIFDFGAGGRMGQPPVQIAAGETLTDVSIEIDPPLQESTRLEAVVHEENGGRLADDAAFVTLGDESVAASGTPVTLIEADGEYGFNYPYYFYAPPVTESVAETPRPIMVQPVNTGHPTDDFSVHREAARRRITERWTRRASEELTVPLLVPVFPRPESEPVTDDHDVHSLDTHTMHITDGPLERVDRQMARMIDHAQESLTEDGYPVAEEVVLNGFSASGTFVNRWTALHPDRVLSLSAGGVNGMVILPIEEAKGHTLNYQIGVADVESLTGEPFDRAAFADVEQFLYMGQLDGNDSLPQRYAQNWYGDQRQIALDVYGIDIQRDRFPYCQTVYEDVDASAYFRIYEGIGHYPIPVADDVIEFHRRAIAGEDLSEFNQDLGTGGDEATGPVTSGTGTPGSATTRESTTDATPAPGTDDGGQTPLLAGLTGLVGAAFGSAVTYVLCRGDGGTE